MSDQNMKAEINLNVNTHGEELIDRLNRKAKQLQASLHAIDADMTKTAKANTSPGSNQTQKESTNQEKVDNDANRSAADLYTFKPRLEAQANVSSFVTRHNLHRLRQTSFRKAERDHARTLRDRSD